MNESNRVQVGKITSAHGIQGMVKVYPMTDTPERLAEITDVYLDDEDALRKVTESRVQKQMVIMKLEGIDTRNQSERLRHVTLSIPIEDRKPLEEGQYFIQDLIGLDVVDTDGERLGRAGDILTQHGNDILVVEGEEDFLVPFVSAFIKEVDQEKIVIDPIEGLIP